VASNLFADEFLAYLKREKRDSSSYQYVFRIFLRWLKKKGIRLERINASDLSRFLWELKQRGIKRSSLQHYSIVLHHLGRYGYQKRFFSHDPAQEVSLSWLDVEGGYSSYQGVLRKITSVPVRIFQAQQLPLISEVEKYLEHRLSQGYSRWSVFGVFCYLRRFLVFLPPQKTKNPFSITKRDIHRFLERRTKPISSRRSILRPEKAIEGFLSFLFHQNGRVFSRPRPQNRSLFDLTVADYFDFCRVHKGLRPATLDYHNKVLAQLKTFLSRKRVADIGQLCLQHVDDFIFKYTANYNRRSKRVFFFAVKSFLKFLFLKEYIHKDLASRLVRPSCFQHDLRPKYLPWEKIQEFLSSFKRDSPKTIRDFAVILLMASYGLRAREVAKLQVDDIDFDQGCFHLRERKDGTPASFPLRPEITAALKDYLKIRPSSLSSNLFVSLTAPFRPLTRDLRQNTSQYLLQHLGRLLPHQSSYVLRHSFAKAMLDRGAPLTAIGSVLGHKSLNSTLAYTRVDIKGLREVADNYANLL
jgi:site-specific recombinase XerD